MKGRKKNFGKTKIVAALVCGFACLFAVFLIILNIFIPLKYLSAYLTATDKNTAGQMRVSFVDAGYGDCTVVEFPDGKVMLVDGGNGTYPNDLKIFKALNKRGIKNIDYLVCTSVCPERCGGLAEVMKYKGVAEVYAPYFFDGFYNDEYRGFCEAVQNSGTTRKVCEYGEGVFNDEQGYCFCFLSPSSHLLPTGECNKFNEAPNKENADNASAVMWLEYDGIGFLLSGNAGAAVQEKVISAAASGTEINGRILNIAGCAVLKVPDHGSAAAAYGGLYGFFNPQAVVISSGENGYGCPSVQALSCARETANGNLYRTDEDGTVTVTVRGGTFIVEKEKK